MYRLIEHEADIGIEGSGKTIEEAFAEAAKALFAVMVDLKNVRKKKRIRISCEANDISALLVEWLNQLISKGDINGMFFSDFKVRIKENKGKYVLSGTAIGEKINLKKHKIKTEVKAATYAGLKVWHQ